MTEEYDSAVEYMRECYPTKFDAIRCYVAENYEGTEEDLDEDALEECCLEAAEDTACFVEVLDDGSIVADV